MRLMMIGVLAVALAAPSLAIGQANRGGSAGPPVGHRQPSAREVPQDQASPQANPAVASTKEDRALERALKGICRGC